MDATYWSNHRDWLKATPERLVIKYKIESDLSKILRQTKVKTVLDLACGFGVWFPLYSDLGLQVTGVDFSGERLQVARQVIAEFGLKGISLVEADLFNPEVYKTVRGTGSAYDLVMLSYVLQHLLPDQVKWIIEQIRDLATYVIVISYYSEPATAFIKRYETMCKRNAVHPYSFEKHFNSIAYDYPSLFKLPYTLCQYPLDNALLLFRRQQQ